METYVKTGADGDLRLEAAGLAWLGEAEADGGLHAARVVEASRDRLVEERVAPAPMNAARAEAAGRALAHTHAAGAPWWGAPPAGWDALGGAAGYVLGNTLTPVVARPDRAERSWGAYFWHVRLAPFVEELSRTGFFDQKDAALLRRVGRRLLSGDLDAAQPRLVEGRAPDGAPAVARLHGDLWAGNLLADGDPHRPCGATLVDPMAHGGHAETDLAMLALFGYPHLDRLTAAYDEESPLAGGWRERVACHQLAPLLHHCLLFGAPYARATIAAARRYA